MAKNNINLGTLVGKLGDNVFWRTLGQQRVRAYFKKDSYPVNLAQAVAQSHYANCKAVYQWLPEIWRKACRDWRQGRTSFTCFMSQNEYVAGSMHKGRNGFGRFDFNQYGVNYRVSFGTLQVPTVVLDYFNNTTADANRRHVARTSLKFANATVTTVAAFTNVLLQNNNALREGDIVHFLYAFSTQAMPGWNGALSLGTFPSPWTYRWQGYVKLDKSNNAQLSATMGAIKVMGKLYASDYSLAFYSNEVNSVYTAYPATSNALAAIMVERPSYPRSQRFSSAFLVPAVKETEGSNLYAACVDAAVESYVKEPTA